MPWKGIVNRGFTPAAFAEYLNTITWGPWEPQYVVLHHTAIPDLAMRPKGFSSGLMENLQSYYRDTKKWSAGPHLFVDDKLIWVFTPLTVPGVHAVAYNATGIGIEMLGNYDKEPFHTGRGGQVRDNAVAAMAMLCQVFGLNPATAIKFHRDDPAAKKTCPGRAVTKQEIVTLVTAYLAETGEAAPVTGLLRPQEVQLAKDRMPLFKASAETYEWPPEVTGPLSAELGPDWMALVIAGICSRESRFGLLLDEEGKGDNGHGHGEMQVDDRSHGAFIATGKWQNLEATLEYLRDNVIIPYFNRLVESSELFNEDYPSIFWGAVAAYNAGAGGVIAALENGAVDPDEATTGGDYSRDVKARALELREALEL